MAKKQTARKPTKKAVPAKSSRRSIPPKKPAPKRAAAPLQPSNGPAKPNGQGLTRRDQWWKTFSQTIAVLMRDPGYRGMKIGDLETLVLPPVMSGQCRLAHAKIQSVGKPGSEPILAPVALALWARVSPAIDKLLVESIDKEIALRPSDWASGDHVWLTLVAGEQKFASELLKNLSETVFKGRTVKVRSRGADGKTVVKVLANAAPRKGQI